MPNIFIVNLDKFNFGDQFYGGFDWGFEVLKIYFGEILQKINSLFKFKRHFTTFQIIPKFSQQTIQIRGP